MPSAPLPPKKCAWKRCEVVLPDRRHRWCDEHREPGAALLRADRNARHAKKRRGLVASARSPAVVADGVLLPRPLAGTLAAAVARLDRAVAEYDRCVNVFIGWQVNGHLEGWADLKVEHEQRLRFAITELRTAAREAANALGPVLAAKPGP